MYLCTSNIRYTSLRCFYAGWECPSSPNLRAATNYFRTVCFENCNEVRWAEANIAALTLNIFQVQCFKIRLVDFQGKKSSYDRNLWATPEMQLHNISCDTVKR